MHISTSSSRETYAPLVSLLGSILFHGLQSTSSASAFCSLSRRGDQKVRGTCILSHVITQLFSSPVHVAVGCSLLACLLLRPLHVRSKDANSFIQHLVVLTWGLKAVLGLAWNCGDLRDLNPKP